MYRCIHANTCSTLRNMSCLTSGTAHYVSHHICITIHVLILKNTCMQHYITVLVMHALGSIRRTCRMPTTCNCCWISYMMRNCNMTDINYHGIYSLCKNVKGIKLHACVVEELMTYPVILSILYLLTQPLIHAIYILPLSVPRFFLYSLVT